MRRVTLSVFIFVLILLSAVVSFAQDELAVPPYATPFDLEQTAGDFTVRVLWASADESRIEIAWSVERQGTQTHWDWTVEVRHGDTLLGSAYSGIFHREITPESNTLYFLSHLAPSGLQGLDQVTLDVRFAMWDSYRTTSRGEGREPLVTVTPIAQLLPPLDFTLDLPFHDTRYWQGEQLVNTNGIRLTLKAVEYTPSRTYLTVCYPRLSAATLSGSREFEPYVGQLDYDVLVIPVGVRYEMREIQAQTTPGISPEIVMTPEATDEFGHPLIPTVTPEKCVDLAVTGRIPEADGVLRFDIDELRAFKPPRAEDIPQINAALEEAGMPLRVALEPPLYGLSIISTGSPAIQLDRQEQRTVANLLAPFTSERILGPWTFEVTLGD